MADARDGHAAGVDVVMREVSGRHGGVLSLRRDITACCVWRCSVEQGIREQRRFRDAAGVVK